MIKNSIFTALLLIGISGCEKKDIFQTMENCGESKTDVSAFDIHAIKLGDRFNKQQLPKISNYFRKKLSQSNDEFSGEFRIDSRSKNEIDTLSYVHERDKSFAISGTMDGGDSFSLVVNQNNTIFGISRTRVFSVEPNLQAIKKQLFSKYGKPDMVSLRNYTEDRSFGSRRSNEYFCWGSCRQFNTLLHNEKGRVTEGATCGISLLVDIKNSSTFTRRPVQRWEKDFSISFLLRDGILSEANDKWEKETRKEYTDKLERIKKEISDKESNIIAFVINYNLTLLGFRNRFSSVIDYHIV